MPLFAGMLNVVSNYLSIEKNTLIDWYGFYAAQFKLIQVSLICVMLLYAFDIAIEIAKKVAANRGAAGSGGSESSTP